MIENVLNRGCYIPRKSKKALIAIERLNEEGFILPITKEDSLKEFDLLQIFYKGKGKRKSFQGFAIYRVAVGSISKRTQIYFRKLLACSNCCLDLAEKQEGDISKRIINKNVFKLSRESALEFVQLDRDSK